QEILVRYPELAVDRVHARDCALPALAVAAVLDDLADDEIGVVVAFLRARLGPASPVTPPADARRGERAEERQFERTGHVPRERDPAEVQRNLLTVSAGIEGRRTHERDSFIHNTSRVQGVRFLGNRRKLPGRNGGNPPY